MVGAVARILQERAPLVRNASAAATELIREAIVDGRLPPGQRLKEEELARELGISRTPVREALLILQTEGLVDAAPNRGAAGGVALEQGAELVEVLEVVGVVAADDRAAANISEAAVEGLRASCERFENLIEGNVQELVKENLLFHNVILDAARSRRVAELIRKVIELPLVYRSYIWYSVDQRRISAHYHRQITKALEARDGERAELVMKEHVFEARDVLVTHVRELEEQP